MPTQWMDTGMRIGSERLPVVLLEAGERAVRRGGRLLLDVLQHDVDGRNVLGRLLRLKIQRRSQLC